MLRLTKMSHRLLARARKSVTIALIILLLVGLPSATAKGRGGRFLSPRKSRIRPTSGRVSAESDDEETGFDSPETRLRCTAEDTRCPNDCRCISTNDDLHGTCRNITVLEMALRRCDRCGDSSDCPGTETCVLHVYPEVSIRSQSCSSCVEDAEREARDACLKWCGESYMTGADSDCKTRDCRKGVSAHLDGAVSSATKWWIDCTCRCCDGVCCTLLLVALLRSIASILTISLFVSRCSEFQSANEIRS